MDNNTKAAKPRKATTWTGSKLRSLKFPPRTEGIKDQRGNNKPFAKKTEHRYLIDPGLYFCPGESTRRSEDLRRQRPRDCGPPHFRGSGNTGSR
jgi:hypothetical protein